MKILVDSMPEEAKEEPVLLSATEIASKIDEVMRRIRMSN